MEARARPAPAYAPFWQTLAALRHWSADLDRAEDAYKQASRARPDRLRRQVRHRQHAARARRLPAGLRAFEDRPDGRYGPARRFPTLPVWGGAKIDGTLLVFCEQGLATSCSSQRFVPAARERAGALVFVVDGYWRRWRRLLASLAGVDHLLHDAVAVDALERSPAARTSVLSLAYLLDVVPERLPGPVPYLAAPDDRVETWSPRVAALPGSRSGCVVGAHRGDHGYLTGHKSVPVAALAPIVAQSGGLVRQPAAGRGRRPDTARRAPRIASSTGPGRSAISATRRDHRGARPRRHDRSAVAHVRRALGKPVWLLDAFFNACCGWRLHPDRRRGIRHCRSSASTRSSTGPDRLPPSEAELARVISGARTFA